MAKATSAFQLARETGRRMAAIATFGVDRGSRNWIGKMRKSFATMKAVTLPLSPQRPSTSTSIPKREKEGSLASGSEAQTRRRRVCGSGLMEVPGSSQNGTRVNQAIVNIACDIMATSTNGMTTGAQTKTTFCAACHCVQVMKESEWISPSLILQILNNQKAVFKNASKVGKRMGITASSGALLTRPGAMLKSFAKRRVATWHRWPLMQPMTT